MGVVLRAEKYYVLGRALGGGHTLFRVKPSRFTALQKVEMCWRQPVLAQKARKCSLSIVSGLSTSILTSSQSSFKVMSRGAT